MNCPKCGVSVFETPFMRINQKGEDGIFWCENCVKEYEPELYKNEIEDGGKLMEDIKGICYQDKSKANVMHQK